MFKVGDEVSVKGAITDVHEGTDHPYFVAVNYDSVHWVSEDKIIPMDKTYADGLADAWELAKKIALEPKHGGFCNVDLYEIFGTASVAEIFKNNTAEEALAKIEAYEKEKSEIKVGDVVEFYYETEEPKEKGVVTWVLENGVTVVWVSGETEHCKKTELTKTGKHIDIESLLRQIGE